MAAGSGFKTFTTGEVLTAADVNNYLMQGVWVFASAAARSAAVTSPQEGNMSFLKDTNSLEYYSGSAWVAVDTSATVPGIIGGKNAVINGALDIWQRGTSFTAVSGYTADRWFANHGVAGRTVSRQTTSDTTNLPFIQYCLRYQRDSGNTNTTNSVLQQSFESVNSIPFAGKTVTLSFYARKGANYSAASDALIVYLISGTGTDQNYQSGSYTGAAFPINNQTATLTTTWQRFTFTGTVASTATELTVFFQSTPVGTAGANDWFEITGIQLEAASSATVFSRNGGNLGAELLACQRYYYKETPDAQYAAFGMGVMYNQTNGYYTWRLPVTMRSTPTFAVSSTASHYVNYTGAGLCTLTSAPSYQGIGKSSVFIYTAFAVAAGNAAGQSFAGLTDSGLNGYLAVSAEL